MLSANFVLHSNGSKITLLTPFDPLLFLLLVILTAAHCEKKSLLSDYCLMDRHNRHTNVHTHTHTHNLSHIKFPQSTYCPVAAVSQWDQ